LELKGNKYVLGEFLEFKGQQEDIMALRNIKRSKVSRLIIQKTSMFGLGNHSNICSAFLFMETILIVNECFFIKKEPEIIAHYNYLEILI
jgi:hypothetical protein